MATESIKQDRKFLHDLATPLSILRMVLKRTSAMLREPHDKQDKAKIQELMAKAIEAVDSIEKLHADHKNLLFERECSTGDQKAS